MLRSKQFLADIDGIFHQNDIDALWTICSQFLRWSRTWLLKVPLPYKGPCTRIEDVSDTCL